MGVVLFLCGPAGAGKDTLATGLQEAIPDTQRIAYADALYREAAQAFDVPEDLLRERSSKNRALPQLTIRHAYPAAPHYARMMEDMGYSKDEALSPRTVLETYGTEYRRKVGGYDAYWTDKVHPKMHRWAENPDIPLIVVTDLRFVDTELLAFKQEAAPEHSILVFEVSPHAPATVLPMEGHVSRKPIPEEHLTSRVFNVAGYPQAMISHALDTLSSFSLAIKRSTHRAHAQL